MLVKSERLKISLQTDINYMHIDICTKRYNISANQEQHGAIKFAIKELDFSKLLINLIYL